MPSLHIYSILATALTGDDILVQLRVMFGAGDVTDPTLIKLYLQILVHWLRGNRAKWHPNIVV
jgi:hypothetical protein